MLVFAPSEMSEVDLDISFFKNLWLCWVLVAARRLSLVEGAGTALLVQSTGSGARVQEWGSLGFVAP